VNQQVINVDNDVGDAIDHLFHETLEAGWASQQAHGASHPLELTLTWNGESGVGSGSGMQVHLPEASG